MTTRVARRDVHRRRLACRRRRKPSPVDLAVGSDGGRGVDDGGGLAVARGRRGAGRLQLEPLQRRQVQDMQRITPWHRTRTAVVVMIDPPAAPAAGGTGVGGGLGSGGEAGPAAKGEEEAITQRDERRRLPS